MNDEINWHDSEKPIRYWRLLDAVWISGITAFTAIAIIYGYYLYTATKRINWIVIVIWLFLFTYLVVLFLIVRRRKRKHFVSRIGFDKRTVYLNFSEDVLEKILLMDIREAKMIQSDSKWKSDLFSLPQCILVLNDGKELNAIITGNSAIQLYQNFRKYKEQVSA
jgi:hypothetical protein